MLQLPYSSILVSGADALSFLQGQLTADVAALEKSDRVRAAWCNPKGRVICIVQLARSEDGYTLTLPAELGDAVLQRLQMFRFRAKVDFAMRPATIAELGIESTIDDWLLEKLRAGIPEIWAAQSEQFTPHMLNLDLLGAIDFDKGCYTGQEVVARTHYRGATKRRCLRFASGKPVLPGAKVYEAERAVGDVVNAIGTDLLAVVPIDSAATGLTVDGMALRPRTLPYL